MDRSKSVLDLREGDALRQRDAVLNVLWLADHDIQVSIIEFPGSFGWDGDKVVQSLETRHDSSFEGILEGRRHSGEQCGRQMFRGRVSTHVESVAGGRVCGERRMMEGESHWAVFSYVLDEWAG